MTIVTETITLAKNVEEDDEESTDEAASSYFDCIQTCETSTENILDIKIKSELKGVLKTSTNKTEKESSILLSEPSTLDDSKYISEEYGKEENPAPPHIQLATGLPCCMSRLVTTSNRSWTFYLSGLIRNIPLHCTDK